MSCASACNYSPIGQTNAAFKVIDGPALLQHVVNVDSHSSLPIGVTAIARKAEFGGFDVLDAWRLKALEDESAKLKKLLAEQMLDNVMLRDVASKKW